MYPPQFSIGAFALLCFVALTVSIDLLQAAEAEPEFTEAKSGKFDNFEYRVRLLMASDGGLVGIYLELVNKSKKKLAMRRPVGRVPIAISLYDSDGNDLIDHSMVEKNRGKDDPKAMPIKDQAKIEWKMEPLGKESHFTSLREELGTLPKAKRYEGCLLYVYSLATPSSAPPSFESALPPRLFHDVIETQRALELNGKEAYQRSLTKLRKSEVNK